MFLWIENISSLKSYDEAFHLNVSRTLLHIDSIKDHWNKLWYPNLDQEILDLEETNDQERYTHVLSSYVITMKMKYIRLFLSYLQLDNNIVFHFIITSCFTHDLFCLSCTHSLELRALKFFICAIRFYTCSRQVLTKVDLMYFTISFNTY